jgi:hypothetical protein
MTKADAMVKLDLDGRRARIRWRRWVWLLRRAGYEPVALGYRRSPGGKGWHVWIEVDPMPRRPEEVVAVEAMLGSDPARVAMQLVRAKSYYRMPGWERRRWNTLYLPDQRRARRLKLRGVRCVGMS